MLRGYSFVRRLQQYRRIKTGIPVARSEILKKLDRSIDGRDKRIQGHVIAAMEGRISPNTFGVLEHKLLKRQALQSVALVSGGRDQVTQRDYGRVGAMLRGQYAKLAALTNEIANGTVSPAQAMNRAHRYLGETRSLAISVEREHQPPSPPGKTRIERRILDRQAKHCFVAGTLILTEYGEQPIETIRVGRRVWTRQGLRTVTETFAHMYKGALTHVQYMGRSVTCTPAHLFATGPADWTEAQELGRQKPMLFKHAPNSRQRHITLPDAFNSEATNGEVFGFGSIAPLLSKLPRKQGLEAGVAMPPVSVCLNHQMRAYETIQDKLGLYGIEGDIRHAQRVKVSEQCHFQACRRCSLCSRLALENSGAVGRIVLPSVAAASRKAFFRAWQAARVILAHVLGRGVMYPFSIYVWRQRDAQAMGAILNCFEGYAKVAGNAFCALYRIAINNVLIHLRRSVMVMQYRVWQVLTAIGLAAVRLIPADGADLKRMFSLGLTGAAEGMVPVPAMAASGASLLLRRDCSPSVRTSAATGLRSGIFGAKWLATVCTKLCSFDSRHSIPSPLSLGNGAPSPTIYHTPAPDASLGTMVYNLEVQDVPEYVAEGFVVHNCQSCLDYYYMAWQPERTLPSPGQACLCTSSCKCTLISKTIQARDALEWVGRPGRNRPPLTPKEA